jgi:transposase
MFQQEKPMTNSRFLPILAGHHAAGMSIRDAAKAANCSEKTAYTLAGTAEFKAEVSGIRDAALTQAVGVLTDAATKAAKALVRLLDSEDEKIVLAASAKLLGSVGPFTEQHELRARVNVIENQGTMLRVAQ